MNVADGASKKAEQQRRRDREQASARSSFAAGGEEGSVREAGVLSSRGARSVQPASLGTSQAQGRRNSSRPLAMGLVSFSKVVLPAFLGSCVVSYAFWDLTRNRKIFGGTVPRTMQGSEWANGTNKRLDAWPREAAGPVVMNPISRQNYHKA